METDPAKFIEDNYRLIRDAVRSICSRHNIYSGEEEDFASHVMEKLIEDNYKKIRDFKGRSSFRTYLHVVVSKIFIDEMRSRKGRWRHSEEAKKIGKEAVILEELTKRDNYTFEEAFEALTTNYNFSIDKNKAYDIFCRLPEKSGRGMKFDVGDESLSFMHDPGSLQEKTLIGREVDEKKAQMLSAVEEIRPLLSSGDRLLLKMVFEDDFSVSEVARILRKDRNQVDRRIKSILEKFKEGILRSGININDAVEAIRSTGRE